jgi:hypothetical protein
VAEQPSFIGLAERWAWGQLFDPADVMQKSGRQQQVGAEPWVKLRRLTADRGHADRVLEQATGV